MQEGKVKHSANLRIHPTCSYRAEAQTPPSSPGTRLFPQHRRRGLLASLPNLTQLQHNYCQRQALAAQPRGFPASNSNRAPKQEDGEIGGCSLVLPGAAKGSATPSRGARTAVCITWPRTLGICRQSGDTQTLAQVPQEPRVRSSENCSNNLCSPKAFPGGWALIRQK